MFVFKAAVVGAGTMGGQIAQTIAAAGIPVMLKDINQELVQAGLDEARNVTAGQVGKLVEKGKLTAEQGDAQIAEIVGRIHGGTTYEGFGDVDFSVFKNTKIGERVSTQFRVEMFNLFNRTNYAPPLEGNFNPSFTYDNALNLFTTIGSFNGAPGIGAGEPFNTQLALKILF